jgi:hypothetical protein
MYLTTQIKAQAIAYGLKSVTGYDPLISERPDGTALISFNAFDLPAIRKNIESIALKAGTSKGDVSVALKPIFIPLALKYLLPVILGLVAIGAVSGFFIGKKGWDF